MPHKFSKEKEYDEQVYPLINALTKKCQELGLPLVVDVLYEYDGESEGHVTTILPVENWNPPSHVQIARALRVPRCSGSG